MCAIFRPCDVFAHCTNNIGSYDCTCFPGYEGDGHNCQGRNSKNVGSRNIGSRQGIGLNGSISDGRVLGE